MIKPIRIFRPTRYNMIEGDEVVGSWVTASGHGSRVEDSNGDESDGYDSTVCPIDFQQAGEIVDDEMNFILVQPLPPGVRLTALFGFTNQCRYTVAGNATGAMSYALIKALTQSPSISYGALLQTVRNILVAEYSQVPLTTARFMDMNQGFII
ncbi:hypothetical protein BASA83_005690 [Batrachochytrium salamandrivorans]|nr:hypothetical protein BASA83_005690 [Batrachochytrium salamandrivorans]